MRWDVVDVAGVVMATAASLALLVFAFGASAALICSGTPWCR